MSSGDEELNLLSADTLHRDSLLQEKLSSISLRTSGVMSLSLHEEAVSDIVAYESMNTSTVNDTEKMKSGLGGFYGRTNGVPSILYHNGHYYGETEFRG